MTARRAAEFAAQRARAAALVPGATQYQAQVGTLIRRTEFGVAAITRWGLRDLDTGQVVADPSGSTGPAAVTVPVAGHPGETYTYVMPGDHDGEPAPRLAEDIDTLIAWVRELRGVLHVGRQWYDLTGRLAPRPKLGFYLPRERPGQLPRSPPARPSFRSGLRTRPFRYQPDPVPVLIRSAAFSATASTVAFSGAFGMTGSTDASAIRSPLIPCTRSRASTTPSGPDPIRHVPAGW